MAHRKAEENGLPPVRPVVTISRTMGSGARIIAHRLSVMRECDMVLVIDKGRLIETGTHASLLKKDGLLPASAHRFRMRLQINASTIWMLPSNE